MWLVALVASALVYFSWGDVFTSSSRFLNQPDSQKAADLIEERGGGSGSSITQTAESVQGLADGLGGAEKGARELAEGSGALSSGARKLERGLRRLADGAREVSTGTRRTSAGARSLSGGLTGASRGAADLSSGLAQVAGATGSFNAGLAQLSRGGSRLSASADALAAGAGELADGAGDAAAGVRKASQSADALAGGAATLDALVAAYLAAHPEAADDPTYQQIIGAAGQVASGSSQLSAGLQSASAGVSSVASGADKLASGASRLAAGARDLSKGLDRSAGGASTLDDSLGKLAAGSRGLASGVGSAATGSRALASGSERLAGGSGRVASGVRKAVAGAGDVSGGTDALRAGAVGLREGIGEASRGAEKLGDALSSIGTLTGNDSEVVIIRSESLTVDDPAFKREVLRVRDRIAALPPEDVVSVLSRYDEGLDEATRTALTSEDRHAVIMKVELAAAADQAVNHVDGVYEIVAEANATPGFDAAVTGAASLSKDAQHLAGEDLKRGEAIGIPVALVILVVVFGALVAAGLPLAISLLSIVVGLAITVLVGQGFELSVFALNILVATGLAVGIDYSLFIVSRYREERRGGLDKIAAIGAASATASNAVFFSGMTVVLSLVGMLIVPLSIFISLGVGAMSAVFASVAAALTLLPALLALLGDKVDALPVPFLDRRSRGQGEHGWWGRAARRTMRRPAVSLALGVVLLLAIAAPALTMRGGGFSAESFPDDYTSKRGLDMLARDFAAGMSDPVTVVIDGDVGDPGIQAALERFVVRLDADGTFSVTGLSTAADGSLAVLTMVQDADGMTEAAKEPVRDLREAVVPEAFRGADAQVYVGGTTAAQIDSVDLTDGYMPIVIGVVLTLSFFLLLLAFRSVPVALTAILMNLLSVGAAYGALTLVFQQGWGAGLLGLTQVEAIESWVPLLMFCVLFGLSMDYQVFLLSRIRERWTETHDSREAVVFGVQSTAGIITGAALIMVAVFLGMGSGRLEVLQELGFGLAIAVLLDAFVVRVVVAPALIALIGDRYWWMPRWLEWLPRIDIEGPAARPSEAMSAGIGQGPEAAGEGPGATGTGAVVRAAPAEGYLDAGGGI